MVLDYESIWQISYNTCRGEFRLPHEACEDIAQESVAYFFQTYDSSRAPEPYIKWITRCRAIDHLRKEKSQQKTAAVFGEYTGGNQMQVSNEDALADLVTEEEREMIRAFWGVFKQEAPAHYVQIITLRNFKELPYEKIAQEMGITANYARTLHLRAVRRLRETFEAYTRQQNEPPPR